MSDCPHGVRRDVMHCVICELEEERDEARALVHRLREFLGYFPTKNVHPAADVERFKTLCEDLGNVEWLEPFEETSVHVA